MSNLGNQYISSSYQSVLNVGTGSGDYVTSTLKQLTDGYGTSVPVKVSTTDVELSGNISLTGSLVSSIIPAVSNSIDLGSPTKPFRHLYVGSGSVYLDDNPILSLDTPGTDTTIAAPPSGTVQLLNDVIFVSQEGLGYEGAAGFTIVGGGTQFQSQTRYSGDTISFHTGSIQNTNYWVNSLNQITGDTSLELELFKDNLKLATIENSRHLTTYEDSEIEINSKYEGTGSYNGTVTIQHTDVINSEYSKLAIGDGNVSMGAGNLSGSSPIPKSEFIVQEESIRGGFTNSPSSASFTLTGSIFEVTGAIKATDGYIGNVQGTASFASNAESASYASTALTASFAQNSDVANSAISAISADTLEGTGSAVFATTGSNTFNGSQTISGSLNVTGSITALSASITYLETIYQTSSVIYTSGSNVLGDESGDVQTLNGRVDIPLGNLNVTGATTSSLGFFGDLQGTASYASNALSSSHSINADTASYVLNAVSSSYSDFAVSSSQAQNAVSASHSVNSDTSISSSQADNANLLDGKDSSEFATTGSNTFLGKQTINVDDPLNQGLVIASGSGAQAQSIYFATQEFGGNSQPTVFLNGINSYFQSTGNMFFENAPGGSGSGSMNFATNGDLGFTTNGTSKVINFVNPAGLINISGSQFDVNVTNANLTGSLRVSGSADFDVDVEGRIKISGPTTGNTPRLFVSSSTNNSIVAPNFTQVRQPGNNTIQLNNSFGGFVSVNKESDGSETGIAVDGTSFTTNWTKGPILYVNNDPGDSYDAVFGFQDKTNYTDGRITLLKNTDISGSLNVTGSANFDNNVILNTIQPNDRKQNLVILTSKNATSSSATFENYLNTITSSLDNDDVNFIMAPGGGMPPSGLAAFAGSLQISGSNNLILSAGNSTPASLGRKQYLGSLNIGSLIPTLNTSSLVLPVVSNNYFAVSPTLTFTTGSNIGNNAHTMISNVLLGGTNLNYVSASTGSGQSTTFQSNINVGTVNLNASASLLTNPISFTNNINSNTNLTLRHISGSIQTSNNIIGGATTTFNNNYYNSGSNNVLVVSANLLSGQGTIINAAGSPATNVVRPFVGNLIGGQTVNISLEKTGTDLAGLRNSIAYGYGLNVTGSHSTATTTQQGAAFFGRWNGENNGLADSAETVFAIGTGTGNANRRTSLYVTSGSLVGVSGSLDVKGDSIFTGSVTIADNNDLTMYGHKMFNAAEFWSNTTQSGSAGVSGSITFDASGSVAGVSVVSGSRLTVENAGTYNVMFSAQIETSAGADTGYVWFKKNGTNIDNSATKVALANNTAQVMTVNILDEAAANDYYELGYQFTNGHATILSEAASGNIPAIPSVIATVTQAR